MEQKIKQIIAKVREMLKDEEELKELLLKHPCVTLNETANNDFEIESIVFSFEKYRLVVNNTYIYYAPVKTKSKIYAKYNGIDELLNL